MRKTLVRNFLRSAFAAGIIALTAGLTLSTASGTAAENQPVRIRVPDEVNAVAALRSFALNPSHDNIDALEARLRETPLDWSNRESQAQLARGVIKVVEDFVEDETLPPARKAAVLAFIYNSPYALALPHLDQHDRSRLEGYCGTYHVVPVSETFIARARQMAQAFGVELPAAVEESGRSLVVPNPESGASGDIRIRPDDPVVSDTSETATPPKEPGASNAAGPASGDTTAKAPVPAKIGDVQPPASGVPGLKLDQGGAAKAPPLPVPPPAGSPKIAPSANTEAVRPYATPVDIALIIAEGKEHRYQLISPGSRFPIYIQYGSIVFQIMSAEQFTARGGLSTHVGDTDDAYYLVRSDRPITENVKLRPGKEIRVNREAFGSKAHVSDFLPFMIDYQGKSDQDEGGIVLRPDPQAPKPAAAAATSAASVKARVMQHPAASAQKPLTWVQKFARLFKFRRGVPPKKAAVAVAPVDMTPLDLTDQLKKGQPITLENVRRAIQIDDVVYRFVPRTELPKGTQADDPDERIIFLMIRRDDPALIYMPLTDAEGLTYKRVLRDETLQFQVIYERFNLPPGSTHFQVRWNGTNLVVEPQPAVIIET